MIQSYPTPTQTALNLYLAGSFPNVWNIHSFGLAHLIIHSLLATHHRQVMVVVVASKYHPSFIANTVSRTTPHRGQSSCCNFGRSWVSSQRCSSHKWLIQDHAVHLIPKVWVYTRAMDVGSLLHSGMGQVLQVGSNASCNGS